jgi:hypothetical protein
MFIHSVVFITPLDTQQIPHIILIDLTYSMDKTNLLQNFYHLKLVDLYLPISEIQISNQEQ